MEPIISCKKCKKDYEQRRLKCPSCGEVGVAKLYKYVPYSERSLSILINKQIWCPKAKSLNDPFEFYFELDQDNIDGIPIDKDSLEKSKDDAKELAVICFSEINNDILMWAHYAKGHTGFCIEFERNEGNHLGDWNHCVPVDYKPDNSVSTFTPQQLEDAKSLAKIATSKSKHWAYEKEWRLIIRHEFANKLIPIPAQITGIIFGCMMGTYERKTIANILGPDMKYAEANKKSKEFALKVDSISYNIIIKAF